jgi:hypothetical protein
MNGFGGGVGAARGGKGSVLLHQLDFTRGCPITKPKFLRAP